MWRRALVAATLALTAAGLISTSPARAQEIPAAAPGAESLPAVVARIEFASKAALDDLAARYDVWEVNYGDGYAVVMLGRDEALALQQQGVRWETDDLRSAQIAALPASAGVTDDGFIRNFECYRTVDRTYADLARLATEHPTLARWVDFGDSWDKVTAGGPPGDDLRALVVTNWKKPAPKFRFVLMAAIHARELTPAETATRFAEELVAKYGTDPDATWLLDYGELHVIPMANPDGRRIAEQGILWRKNTHNDGACLGAPGAFFSYGVDLNRNSSFQWNSCSEGSCSSGNSCSMTFRGLAAASEPETLAIQKYVSALYPDLRAPELDASAPITTSGLFISLHSYGSKVLYPWGFSAQSAPNGNGLRSLGQRLASFTGYDACQTGEPGCLYAVDGSTDDWTYGTLGLASYTIEMGANFFESCSYFERTVNPDVTDALMYGFKAARRPYELGTGPLPASVTVTPTRVAAGEPVTLTVLFESSPVVAGGAGSAAAAGTVLTATYAISLPQWAGGAAVPLLPADGAFDSPTEVAVATVDTHGWPLGKATLFVEAQDSAGNAGVTGSASVEVVFKQILVPVLPPPVRIYFPTISGGSGDGLIAGP